MINPKKVRLMTKLAVYEEGPGKKDLRINGYSKRTYVNIKQLESVIAITAAYILAMVLYCFGIYTDIMSRGLSFPYQKYIVHAVILYVIIVVLDIVCIRRYYTRVYEKMRVDMAQLVYFKEWLTTLYKRHVEIILPILKLLFAFFALSMFQRMFYYNEFIDKPWVFLAVSAVQAFLPISFLYYAISILIMINLWNVSMDIFLGFVIFFIICSLAFIRVDKKHAIIIIATVLLFYLKLEYLLPVLLGMSVGFGAILPAAAGIVTYFLSVYMTDVSTLLTTSTSSSFGMGLQRIVNLILIDKKLLVLLVTFALIIFITTLLCHIFYERAWMFAIFVGNIAMVLLLLFGRLIFELDYTIWRLFLEVILGIGCCYIYRFFRGIGDVSRIEKVSFEDDEYFYYVKAVPKIKVTEKNRNVTNIKSEENEDDLLFDDITEDSDLPDKDGKEAEKE